MNQGAAVNNLLKWAITLSLGFIAGVLTCLVDEKASGWAYFRHGLAGMAVPVVSLRMNLERELGAKQE